MVIYLELMKLILVDRDSAGGFQFLGSELDETRELTKHGEKTYEVLVTVADPGSKQIEPEVVE